MIVKAELRGKEKAIDNLVRSIEKGNADDSVRERLKNLNEERNILVGKVEKYENSADKMSKPLISYRDAIKKYLMTSESHKVKEFLKRTIESITVDKDDVEIKFK